MRRSLAGEVPAVRIVSATELRSQVHFEDLIEPVSAAFQESSAGLAENGLVTMYPAVGADDPSKCELDASILQKARVFVDALDTVAANGDVHRAISSGRFGRADIAGEIGQVLAGTKAGRTSSLEITVAKFVGIGAQDLAAAETALAKLGIQDTRSLCQK